MKIPEERWHVEVEHKGRQIHRFTTDEKEWLSSTLETLGAVLETEPVNKPRKQYVIRIWAKE